MSDSVEEGGEARMTQLIHTDSKFYHKKNLFIYVIKVDPTRLEHDTWDIPANSAQSWHRHDRTVYDMEPTMLVGWKLYHGRKHPERDHDGETRLSRSPNSSSSLEELENLKL